MIPRPPRLQAPITQWTLILAPELAILAVLDKALLTTAHAIDAAQPQLHDADAGEEDSALATAARALINSVHDCRSDLHRYRHHVLMQLALNDPDDAEDVDF